MTKSVNFWAPFDKKCSFWAPKQLTKVPKGTQATIWLPQGCILYKKYQFQVPGKGKMRVPQLRLYYVQTTVHYYLLLVNMQYMCRSVLRHGRWTSTGIIKEKVWRRENNHQPLVLEVCWPVGQKVARPERWQGVTKGDDRSGRKFLLVYNYTSILVTAQKNWPVSGDKGAMFPSQGARPVTRHVPSLDWGPQWSFHREEVTDTE